jgi:hypothetical protein
MQVQPGEFKSAIQCFKSTFKGEGIRALWKGTIPALTGALSENAVAFGVNGAINRLIFRNEDTFTQSKFRPFIIGAITGAFTAIVLCPCDVIKCRAQLSRSQGHETSITDLCKKLYKTQGLRGFYTGFAAQVMRDIPFYAAFFGTYSTCCEYLKVAAAGSLSDTSVYFLSGG